MPTIVELNEMTMLMFGVLWERTPDTTCTVIVTREDKAAVMMAVLSHKRNEILADILTVVDK